MLDPDGVIAQAVAFLDRVPGYVWDGETIPVPIEDIADSHLGLEIREVTDIRAELGRPTEPDSVPLSGALVPAKKLILVNAEESRRWPRRRRYTIAHEVAHWVLHRDRAVSMRCSTPEVEPSPLRRYVGLDSEPIEGEANLFGGVLLMPPHLLRRFFADRERDPERIAEAFDISSSAVRSREAMHYAYEGEPY